MIKIKFQNFRISKFKTLQFQKLYILKFKIADLINDGPIIRYARMKAFEIIKNDANLTQENHSFIKQKFDDEYLDLFLKTTVN